MSKVNINSLAHTSWNCKYHIVFAPKYRRKVFYSQKRLENWCNSKKFVRMERSKHRKILEIIKNFIENYSAEKLQKI